MRADLSWWANFLNGNTFFVGSEPVSSDEFSADACPVGGGVFFLGGGGGEWFYTNWEVDHPNVESAHINSKETFSVLLALSHWRYHFSDKWVVVYSVNTMTICALNEGTCRNCQVMQWLRNIFWLSATYNFRITVCFIPSKPNSVADTMNE